MVARFHDKALFCGIQCNECTKIMINHVYTTNQPIFFTENELCTFCYLVLLESKMVFQNFFVKYYNYCLHSVFGQCVFKRHFAHLICIRNVFLQLHEGGYESIVHVMLARHTYKNHIRYHPIYLHKLIYVQYLNVQQCIGLHQCNKIELHRCILRKRPTSILNSVI